MTHRNQREYNEAMVRRNNRQSVAKQTLGSVMRKVKELAAAQGVLPFPPRQTPPPARSFHTVGEILTTKADS